MLLILAACRGTILRGMSPSGFPFFLHTVFLAAVLLGVSTSVDLFLFFPPPGVFEAMSNSGERFPNVRAFLFTDRGAVASGVSLGDTGDLEAFSAWLLGNTPFSSKD